MRKIDKIILHCSATPEGRHVTVRDIDRWHRDRGFSEIGYHHVIYLDGSIHRGRPEEKAGAHKVITRPASGCATSAVLMSE